MRYENVHRILMATLVVLLISAVAVLILSLTNIFRNESNQSQNITRLNSDKLDTILCVLSVPAMERTTEDINNCRDRFIGGE